MQVVDHVAQSQYALQLLLPQGDYAAALDIISDIQVSMKQIASPHCQCTYIMAEHQCIQLL